MPSAVPDLPKWQRPQKTKQLLPWADIKVLDLGKFDKPGGKQELAEELRQAVCPSPKRYRDTSLILSVP